MVVRRGNVSLAKHKAKVAPVYISREMLDKYREEPAPVPALSELEERREFNEFLRRCREKYWSDVGVNIGNSILDEILVLAWHDIKKRKK